MMTTPSGDPYQYGDDTVAARLEVDLPPDAINNLAELSKHTADIRANMEATAKYNQDYLEYLKQLPTALGEVETAQGRMSASQSAIFGGESIVPNDRTPTAMFVDGQAGAGRTLRSDIDEETLIGLARNNPRQIANMAADRGIDDFFEDDQSYILPRPAPGPGPSPRSGRHSQFAGYGRPPSASTSDRSSVGPGDDDGRAAGTTTGRQVTPEGTESQVERAAARLLEQLEQRDANRPGLNEQIRGFGSGFENNQFMNYLRSEGGVRGQSDALGFLGGIGNMVQQSGEGFLEKQAAAEAEQSNLLSTAADVAQLNPQLAEQLRARAAGMSGKLGGMARLAPLARGAGVVGAGVAGVAAINAGIQKTGEWAHDMQGTGVQMGGGFNEGLAFESSIRTMAMNPFISTEQSRRIMQEALQSGYTGKEFDTMTDFMAENLKQMNMEAAESMKLLQQNVLKGGQEVESLQAQLSQNVGMAGETNLSADQINNFFERFSGGLIDQGGEAAPSGAISQEFSTLYEDNPVLREQGRDLLSGMLMNDPTFQAYFRQQAGAEGIPTSAMPRWAANNMEPGEVTQASIESLQRMLQPYMAGYTSGDPARVELAIQGAASILKTTPNVAEEFLADFASDRAFSRSRETSQQWEEMGGGKINENASNIAGWGLVKSTGRGIMTAGNWVRQGWNWATGDDEQLEQVKQTQRDRSARGNLDTQLRGVGAMAGTFSPEVLEQFALEEYSGNIRDVVVVDEDGNERRLGASGLRDKKNAEMLSSGELRVKDAQGNIVDLREWSNTQETDAAGSGGNYIVELGPYARQVFNLEGPNPVQNRANRGVGTHNSSDATDYPLGHQGPGR